MKYYLLRNKEDWIVRYGIREESRRVATKKKITDDWQQLFPELKKTKLLEMDNRFSQLITGIYLKVVRNTYYTPVAYDTQISKLQEEYNRYYSLKASLGDDLKEGLISKEEFDDFRESYGRKCEELEQMIENQKKLVKQMFEGGVSATVQLEDWKSKNWIAHCWH